MLTVLAARVITIIVGLFTIESATGVRRERRQPVLWAITKLIRAVPRLRNLVVKATLFSIYQTVSYFGPEDLQCINYGYASIDDSEEPLQLLSVEEQNRFGIQLYRATVGDVDLSDKDVLEVGCGRGGGTSFIARHLMPRGIVGVDLARKAINFCNNHYRVDGLSFRQGDAENLPFAASSFDAIVNVESSHGYPNIERFLAETFRVLRPGGRFLLSDFRQHRDVDTLKQQMIDAGYSIESVRIINENVVKALDFTSERTTQMIRSRAPRFLQGWMLEFGATQGSETYAKLASGEMQYLRFLLRKASLDGNENERQTVDAPQTTDADDDRVSDAHSPVSGR